MEIQICRKFSKTLPAKSDDPITQIFLTAMTELVKTRSKSSAVQAARVERVLEISTDNQIKNIEKILRFWLQSEQLHLYRIIRNGWG